MAAKPQKLGLARDVLDKLLVNREGMPVGRVDGIVLLLAGKHSQPRVLEIETGMATLARRLSSRGARALHWLTRACGLTWKRSVRVPWTKVEIVGKDLQLALHGEDSPLLQRERWLRDHIIRHLPANGMKSEK